MRILLTGGTGFVGQALCPRLAAAGHEVVILSRQAKPRLPRGATSVTTRLDELDASTFGGIVNLAGAPIGEARWTPERRRLLVDSRVETTRRLVEWLQGATGARDVESLRGATPRPTVLVSASAVGYYGEQGDRVVTEDTAPTPGFTYELCAAWEREAERAGDFGARVCRVRLGVVLDRDGGALTKMLPAFRLGAGGRLGSGRHWFPWIHREDVVAIFQWLLENDLARGAYNASAPQPVTNADFTRVLARTLRRPAVLPMPAAALKLLFGEMSELLLMSDRMVPQRLLDEGFRFRYPGLDAALATIFRATAT